MSSIFFISDLHLGHKNILNFSGNLRDGSNSWEHDCILITKISSTVTKRDTLFILGDACFDMERMNLLEEIPATKILVRGNHDNFQDGVYHKYFKSIEGIVKHKRRYWLTHCPIHPQELRGKQNIHGHVHFNTVLNNQLKRDERYINVCVEACDGFPVSYEDIRDGHYKPRF